MENFGHNFKFFKDLVESLPGETDTVPPLPPQKLSRTELQERLNAKIAQVQKKKLIEK